MWHQLRCSRVPPIPHSNLNRICDQQRTRWWTRVCIHCSQLWRMVGPLVSRSSVTSAGYSSNGNDVLTLSRNSAKVCSHPEGSVPPNISRACGKSCVLANVIRSRLDRARFCKLHYQECGTVHATYVLNTCTCDCVTVNGCSFGIWWITAKEFPGKNHLFSIISIVLEYSVCIYSLKKMPGYW